MRFVEQRTDDRASLTAGEIENPNIGAGEWLKLCEFQLPAFRGPRRRELVPWAFEQRPGGEIGVSRSNEQIEGTCLAVREGDLQAVRAPGWADAAPIGRQTADRTALHVAKPEVGAAITFDGHRKPLRIR